MKEYFILLVITGILFNASFVFAQELPRNFEDAETMGERIADEFPRAMKAPWNEAVSIWKNMFSWFKSIWRSYLYPWLKAIWNKILSILGREVEVRELDIKEEFKKETEEMKEDIPKTTKSLWQRFKKLIE